ncbi:toxin glutamine deamidase domain-containing protein, partial [Micromonospora sp. NPDC049799]|uniref:toxin glutamine deamidase domain-containing protein n=1 Tax=Micromonospora sp. NPDC049799 TaxID=3154741 RepID=UPI00340F74E2
PEWYAAQWAADRDAFERRRYRGYYESQRALLEDKRRFDEVARLRSTAEEHHQRARDYTAYARYLVQSGRNHEAAVWQRRADRQTRAYGGCLDRAEAVLAGTEVPKVVDIDDPTDFHRINDDVGDLTLGAVDTGNGSALTGDDDPPPIDHTRRYGVRGGLRPPLALHQTDVERQMPRHPDGSVARTADPRRGGWFRLMNDGGPQADPTRGINCLDCTLSLFDTWVHGRPRVAAPRTFDAYENGNVTRPLDGEANGPARIEDVTGGRFQRLCAPSDGTSPVHPKQALDAGYRNLHDQLVIGGHGSFAFVINQWEGGGSHIWVALNQNGTVLHLDPQSGEISDKPLGGHRGHPHSRNAIDADVLILGPDARPMPLAGLRRGLFSQRPDLPEYPPAREHQGYGEPYLNRMHLLAGPGSAEPAGGQPRSSGEHQSANQAVALELSDAELAALTALRGRAEQKADEVEAALDRIGWKVTQQMNVGHAVRLSDQENRVKGLDSLSRKYVSEARAFGLGIEEFSDDVNDVLRFCLVLPADAYYRDAVVSVLDELAASGFVVRDNARKNFWHSGNKFYGFNCTVVAPDGLAFELQLHTELSRAAWLATHEAYEVLRQEALPAEERVHAFLDMLATNRSFGMPERVPVGLSEHFPTKNSTFAKWILANPQVWQDYRNWLLETGQSFRQVVEERGLRAQDFPMSSDLLERLESDSVDLLRDLPE